MEGFGKKKVVVATSGGVDSSVAAALLKKGPEFSQRDVIGVFMKLWPQHHGKAGCGIGKNSCSFLESEKRARLVAAKLNIPFYVFNFEKEFKEKVVDYFLKSYKKGITPNPCVICNKEIKFGLLLKEALALDVDFVATGHYARLRREFPISKFQFPNIKLLRAKDKNKDQSYFLWMLNQKQLKRILFPIGDYTRKETLSLARKFRLPVLSAKKSTEICFIQTTINDFLKKHLKEQPGDIADSEGKIVGKHRGLWFYTIGQRKGINLSGGPYYVLAKDLKKNILIVSKNEKDLYKKELICKNINWINGKKPKLPLKIKAKIRYRHEAALAIIAHCLRSKVYRLKFKRPQRAITPGQSVVFYKNQEVLGGGIIKK